MGPLYLVRLAGIEPTTPWFVAKYSIQLSYSREALHYGVQLGRPSTISEKTRRLIDHRRLDARQPFVAQAGDAVDQRDRDRAALVGVHACEFAPVRCEVVAAEVGS